MNEDQLRALNEEDSRSWVRGDSRIFYCDLDSSATKELNSTREVNELIETM